MIDKEEAIKRLIKAYPSYFDEFKKSINSHLAEDGTILWLLLISTPLSQTVCNNFINHNYENSDNLFNEIENLINNGDKEVQAIICTGFLESMQNQTQLNSTLWAPLLGTEATNYCKKMDDFHGVKTAGLSCYNA